MSNHPDLARLLDPRSVAVVGATDRPGSYAHATLSNLVAAGFAGVVRGVHPTRTDVLGFPCTPTIDDAYDAVVIATPAQTVPEYLRQARAASCGGAVVYAAGFAEAGRDDLQADLLCAAGDMPVIGPNGNGLVSVAARAPLWGDAVRLPVVPGPIGLITHSGNVGVLALAHRAGLGLNCVVSLGNAATVDAGAALANLAVREGVRAIALYLEADGDGARLADALAVCAERDVRIAVLKVGRTDRSRAIGAAHTSALAGDARVFAALIRDAGGVMTRDLPELLEVTRALAVGRRSPGAIVIATASGGDAAVAADLAADVSADLLDIDVNDERLTSVLPATATATNPLDHTNHVWADTDAVAAIVGALADRPGVGHVVYIQDEPPGLPPFAADEWGATRSGAVIGARRCGHDVMLVAGMPGQEPVGEGPTGAVSGVRAALLALAALQRPHPSPTRLRAIAALVRRGGSGATLQPLAESVAKAWLATSGITVPRGQVCVSSDESTAVAAELGWPVVMKVCAPGLLHVSDLGGVLLGVDESEAEASAVHLLQLMDAQRVPFGPGAGVLVEEMVPGDLEIIVSVSRDGVVPHLVVGRGGTATEIEDDVEVVPLPVSPDDCATALMRLRCAPHLTGYRGRSGLGLPALIGMMTALAEAFETSPWHTVEINPVLLTSAAAVAVDAWIIPSKAPE